MSHHGLKSLDCFLRLLCLFGEFTDIVTFVKMLHITTVNAIATIKSVLASDLFI